MTGYLLDTNVVSELRKLRSGRANPGVAEWARGRDASDLFVSVVTIAEIDFGIRLIERRDPFQGALFRKWLEEGVLPAFAGRMLSVDLDAALKYSEINVPNRCSDRDGWIAATALANGLTVVTRSTKDFERTGVPLLNPWTGEGRGASRLCKAQPKAE